MGGPYWSFKLTEFNFLSQLIPQGGISYQGVNSRYNTGHFIRRIRGGLIDLLGILKISGPFFIAFSIILSSMVPTCTESSITMSPSTSYSTSHLLCLYSTKFPSQYNMFSLLVTKEYWWGSHWLGAKSYTSLQSSKVCSVGLDVGK